jgi:hypothetical protein
VAGPRHPSWLGVTAPAITFPFARPARLVTSAARQPSLLGTELGASADFPSGD